MWTARWRRPCCAALSFGGVDARRRRRQRATADRRLATGRGRRPAEHRQLYGQIFAEDRSLRDAPGTFPQRYCIYDKWWRPGARSGFQADADAPGPILFYTGNESPVEEYINNTGLMWELGEQMGALLVFAEHRYEPLSHPALCGNGTQKCFAYCTTAQANAGSPHHGCAKPQFAHPQWHLEALRWNARCGSV